MRFWPCLALLAVAACSTPPQPKSGESSPLADAEAGSGKEVETLAAVSSGRVDCARELAEAEAMLLIAIHATAAESDALISVWNALEPVERPAHVGGLDRHHAARKAVMDLYVHLEDSSSPVYTELPRHVRELEQKVWMLAWESIEARGRESGMARRSDWIGLPHTRPESAGGVSLDERLKLAISDRSAAASNLRVHRHALLECLRHE